MTDTYHTQIAKLIAMMASRPMTRVEIVTFTGLTQCTVDKWIKAFREARLIYICDYGVDAMGRLRIHKYLFDPGKSDVPFHIIKKRHHERTV